MSPAVRVSVHCEYWAGEFEELAAFRIPVAWGFYRQVGAKEDERRLVAQEAKG